MVSRDSCSGSIVSVDWNSLACGYIAPPVVTTQNETMVGGCPAGFTGQISYARTVTITNGVPDNPGWNQTSNTCVPEAPACAPGHYPGGTYSYCIDEWTIGVFDSCTGEMFNSYGDDYTCTVNHGNCVFGVDPLTGTCPLY